MHVSASVTLVWTKFKFLKTDHSILTKYEKRDTKNQNMPGRGAAHINR